MAATAATAAEGAAGGGGAAAAAVAVEAAWGSGSDGAIEKACRVSPSQLGPGDANGIFDLLHISFSRN